jgi:uncharacterized glyoxalase superfamily protein PhnB
MSSGCYPDGPLVLPLSHRGIAMAKLARIAPELPSADLHKALAYYEQKLGFEVAMRLPENEYAIVERDGVAIHLFTNQATSSTPVGVHIFTADLDQLFAELQTKGATITQEIERKPWGNRDFRVRDEFGNELKFTEPLAND